jgi:metal-responsive CopG/Arc/MetJ family transcriptional regulator
MKMSEEKLPVSVTLEQWLIEIADHICKVEDINRSQLVTRALKYYCFNRIIKARPGFWQTIYNDTIEASNDKND